MATGSDHVQPSASIAVPTTFGAQIEVLAGGTAEVSFTVDQDTLIEDIEIHTDAEQIVRIRFGDTPAPQAPIVFVPGASFHEYLERELPLHLAKLVGEEVAEWTKRNQALGEAAAAGDDEALFELLARDPRQLRSDLVLGRVLTWRTSIDSYNRFFRLKLNRLFASPEVVDDARQRMEQARRNLARLGESQLRLYDQRGKRPLPPTPQVRGVYYAFLCLLQALRTLYRDRVKAGANPRRVDAALSAFVLKLAAVHPIASPFLPWVQTAIRLLRNPDLFVDAGLPIDPLSELVGPGHATPSDTARELTAAVFEVSTDTVERLAAQPVAIPLPSSSDQERIFLAGPLAYDLLEFPEVKPLLEGLTC